MTTPLAEQHDYLSPDQIKAGELRILERLASMCETLGVHYSLAGGTLLGAVRHHGFIPWDDDIDVCMARPDYIRLVKHSAPLLEGTSLKFVPYYETSMADTPFVKLVDTSIVIRSAVDMNDTFLWIDVFPVDGLPQDSDKVKRIYQRARRLRFGVMTGTTTAESGHTIPRRIVKHIASPVLRKPWALNRVCRHLNNLALSTPYGSTPYVGAVTWGMYGAGERMTRAGFEKQTTVEFEGERFTCMSCWDEYLTGIYGDYMQLPPVEKRMTHQLQAWRVDSANE